MLGAKAKRRKLKDLTVEEIQEIVAATHEPYRMQKDIAFEYRVSPQLVSVLVKDAARRPERLENLRRKRE